jgi:sugar O-acyltransferase (sialic acid O-acetyltransferase NeuD family)
MTALPSILLVGAGGHARACIDVVEQEGRFRIAGLVGTRDEVGSRMFEYAVLGTDDDLPQLVRDHARTIVTVGQIKSADLRVRLFDVLESLGAELPTIVSPRAYVSKHAAVGAGTVVLHGAVVNAGASVGRNCIVNSQSLVEHDAVIGDHCHVATGATVNSGVRIGDRTFIGSNTSVRQGTRIGAGCVIGMGQRVLEDCADGTQLPPRQSTSVSTNPEVS